MSPTGPAGGDLNGTYPNPGVNGLAAVIAQSAGNNADIASIMTTLTTINDRLTELSGVDGGQAAISLSGTQLIEPPTNANAVTATWVDSSRTAQLSANNNFDGTWTITSGAGAADDGFLFNWTSF